MKWAGHMVRMKNERLPKCSETKKQEGFRKRGRPPLRWKDFEKREGGRQVERNGQQDGGMGGNNKTSRTVE